MDFKEVGINARNWADSTQDRDYWRALVNSALNLRVSEEDPAVIKINKMLNKLNEHTFL